MECKICKKSISKKRIYCSNKCKYMDAELNKQRTIKKYKTDDNLSVRCKIDGYISGDVHNLSGALTRYSKNKLNKTFDWADWECIVSPIINNLWTCPICEWTGRAENGIDGGGWIGKHLLQTHGLSKLKYVELYPSDNGLWPNRLNKEIKDKKAHTDTNAGVKCEECGKMFCKITETHLKQKHNLTTQEYKEKYPYAKINSIELSNKTREVYFLNTGLSEINPTSNGETNVRNFIESLGYEVTKYKTGFSEIDIFIPVLNIGIEYHGNFYHSQFMGNHLSTRHLDNTIYCEQNNIRLIQIFEDEWLYKTDIVKSRIKSIFGIYEHKLFARKCEIKLIDSNTTRKFLEMNHLQGNARSDYNIGLFFKNELVQCLTFSNINKRTNGSEVYNSGVYENVRACTKLNTNVIGGFGKLLTFFEKIANPQQIISFADRRWASTLNLSFYNKIGFEYVGTTRPCFWVMKDYRRRFHRSDFTKPKIYANNPKRFDGIDLDTVTQFKMLQMLGWDVIWDCGNLKFVKNYNSNVDINVELEEIEIDNSVYLNRKRYNDITPENNDGTFVKCPECNDFFKKNGLQTHLKRIHKKTFCVAPQ